MPSPDETTYRIEITRTPSEDFLEEISGALLRAQVDRVAQDVRDDGNELDIAREIGPAQTGVSLILTAPDPAILDLVRYEAMLRFGHELPDHDEIPPTAALPEQPQTGAPTRPLHEDTKNFAEAAGSFGSFAAGVSEFLSLYVAAHPKDNAARALKDEADYMVSVANEHGFFV